MRLKKSFTKIVFFLFLLLALLPIEVSFAETAGGNAYYGKNYNSFQLTGNGATDMVACYEAQLGKEGADLGFYQNYCDRILVDCAILTGQRDAIGTNLNPNNETYILEHGGTRVTDWGQIKMGDVLIYDNHVGLARDNIIGLHGNLGDAAYGYVTGQHGMVKKVCIFNFNCDNLGTHTTDKKLLRVVRPAYINHTNGTLDLNGLLDGKEIGSLLNYGKANVYICTNGASPCTSLYKSGVGDLCESFPAGTVYRVVVSANDGYSVDGGNEIEGMITSGNTSVAKFTINSVSLKIVENLGSSSGSYGTFDVLKESTVVANDVSSFNQQITKNINYYITDIKPYAGYEYTGSVRIPVKATKGGTSTVKLTFNASPVELSCDWQETVAQPSNVSSENCEIQGKNHYTKVAASSPGTGWTKVAGSAVTKYEPTGEIREFDLYQTPTNTLHYKGFYYFHYCYETKNNRNNWVEHIQRGPATHRCVGSGTITSDADNPFTEVAHEDSDFHDYQYYELRWKPNSNNWTTAWCGQNNSNYFYKMYQYDVYNEVTYYTWKKDSEWLNLGSNILGKLAEGADSVSVSFRFRLKQCDPVSYDVNFKVVNGAWDDGTAADKKVTLDGYAYETLKLSADNIPAVGTKPNTGFRVGSWDAEPGTETEISADTTYTYTYMEKDELLYEVIFKVVNGTWDDGTTEDKVVELTGFLGDELRLDPDMIPVVGAAPNSGYSAGNWDAVPSADTVITADTTYTYTYNLSDAENVMLVVSSADARPGEEVTLGVSIENNPGLAIMIFGISYDDTKLSFIGIEDSGLTGWTKGNSVVAWENDQDTDFNGEIIKLKFMVLDEADASDTIVSVTCTYGNILNYDETVYMPIVQPGKVSVYKTLPGDITGDGITDGRDLLRLKRYLVGLQVELVGNADVNGDGVIDGRDLLRLKKYLVGLNVEIY